MLAAGHAGDESASNTKSIGGRADAVETVARKNDVIAAVIARVASIAWQILAMFRCLIAVGCPIDYSTIGRASIPIVATGNLAASAADAPENL